MAMAQVADKEEVQRALNGKSDDAPEPTAPTPVQAFQGKVFGIMTNALTADLMLVGEKLGIYRKMKEVGKATLPQLAKCLDVSERWLREWAYQQAASGIISTDKDASTFWLEDEQQQVLTNESGPDASPYFSAGVLGTLPAVHDNVARVIEGFKTGNGFGYGLLNSESTCGLCRFLGVWQRMALVPSLCTVPGLEEKLRAGIKVADVGCGCGQALLSLAEAFPNSTFHGYDTAQVALDISKERQAEAGLTDRDMAWRNPTEDGQQLPDAPTYDLVLTLDALHDMARPDKVAQLVRKAIKADGMWISCDPKTAPTAGENIQGHPFESSMFWGFSMFFCMPSGLSEPGGLGLGALGYPEPVARSLMKDAGFGHFEVLDFENPMNNFFLMRP